MSKLGSRKLHNYLPKSYKDGVWGSERPAAHTKQKLTQVPPPHPPTLPRALNKRDVVINTNHPVISMSVTSHWQLFSCLGPPPRVFMVGLWDIHADSKINPLEKVYLLFYFSFRSFHKHQRGRRSRKKTIFSFPTPTLLRWRSIIPPRFLFFVTRARRTVNRLEKVSKQRLLSILHLPNPCNTPSQCKYFEIIKPFFKNPSSD